jgi:Uncharacterized protein conserved in bacteria
MIDLTVWLVITRNTDVDRGDLRDDHRAYMASLVERGLIFASGPTATAPDDESNGGATALRVADEAEARAVMDVEPFIRNGARTYELVAWNIRHGDFAGR